MLAPALQTAIQSNSKLIRFIIVSPESIRIGYFRLCFRDARGLGAPMGWGRVWSSFLAVLWVAFGALVRTIRRKYSIYKHITSQNYSFRTVLTKLLRINSCEHVEVQWFCHVAFYRATACDTTHSIAVAILSVCLSHAWIVTKPNDALQIFWYNTKGQSLCYFHTDSGWWTRPPSVWNLRSKWPTPLKNADFDRFSLLTSQP